MNIYLVGGAVRDEALGLPIKERDWVVVGGSRQALLDLGYKQVGSDFPVFLHPKTHEEYALARTEKKLGVGYYGFVCDANPEVTLEEDLTRRDLTINAMAKDLNGHLIDPYHGMVDLKLKQLRHVSSAFVEDPVRVLRVARFAARFHRLGFVVAQDTLMLMVNMSNNGELSNLVPERVWQEWQISLTEKSPWIFFDTLRACGALRVIFPEITVYPTLAQVSLLSTCPMVRFAATLMHMTVEKIEQLCERLRIPQSYRYLAKLSAQFFNQLSSLDDLTAEEIVLLFEKTDAFRRAEPFEALLVVSQASERWTKLYHGCRDMTARSLKLTEKGEAIRSALRMHRIAYVASILNKWKINEK